MLIIKRVFLTVKVAHFENKTVILTILGHTEGLCDQSEVISFNINVLKLLKQRIHCFSKKNMFLLKKKQQARIYVFKDCGALQA